MRLDTLYKLLMLPTLGVLLVVALLATGVSVSVLSGRMQDHERDGAQAVAQLVAGVATTYVSNFDLTALGNLVKQLGRDKELAFAEIRDASGKSLTADAMAAPASLDGTVAIEQKIVDASGTALGSVHLAFRTEGATLLRNVAVGAVGAAMALVTVMVALVLAWAARRVVCQLGGEPRDVAAVAARVADGDLATRIELRPGDQSSVLHAMLRMVQRLRDNTRRIREASESIASASQEIATGNQDLSQRTEQTASSLQQTASSVQQITGTVRQSAESAAQANQLASSAASVAQRGGEVVAQVVSTMDEIDASSKKIADIIGVIDGIAFQTNILALNAAVEAARAGEQGRGFAVVAGEVRNLAQRSAEAAKEIKGLIGTSVNKVATGSRLVADAGSTMTEIVASVRRVCDMIAEISAAATEQDQGIGQVNTAVAQLDQMTQQNATLVQQSAAAAESLKAQAGSLASLVAAFRLDNAQAGSPSRVSIAATAPAAPTVRAATASRAQPVAAVAAAQPAKPAAKPAATADAGAEGEWESF